MSEAIKVLVFLFVILLLLVYFAAISFRSGRDFGAKEEQRRAVKAGAAHYIANQETGESEFRYREATP